MANIIANYLNLGPGDDRIELITYNSANDAMLYVENPGAKRTISEFSELEQGLLSYREIWSRTAS